MIKFLNIRNVFIKTEYFLKSLIFLSSIFLIEESDFWLKLGIKPYLLLTFLYISTVYSLPLVNISCLIFMGLLKDGYYDYPLGYTSSQFLFLYLLLLRQRKSQILSSSLINWVHFCFFAILSNILDILLEKYLGRSSIIFKKLLGDALLTVALFPLMAQGTLWVVDKFLLPSDKEAT